MSKEKKILYLCIAVLILAAFLIFVFSRRNSYSSQEEDLAVSFLSDFFTWSSERGNKLVDGGAEEYEKRWGTYLFSSAIEKLMQNREPTKYDLIYGANGDAKVQNIVCDFDGETSCRFSLDILYLDENDTEKVMNISGQLRLTNADSFCIDNVHFILD